MDFYSEAEMLIKKCNDCVLTSVSEDGYPRSCFMGIMGYDSFYEIYCSTGYNGTKVKHFKANNRASITYQNNGNSVTLVGDVEFVEDIGQKQRFWYDWMYEHFPKGVQDETYCLLKFTGKEATFWIDKNFLRDKEINKEV